MRFGLICLYLLIYLGVFSAQAKATLEQLNQPLSEIERNTCLSTLTQLKQLHQCNKKHNCEAVFQKYYKNGKVIKNKKYSFKQLFETGNGYVKSLVIGGGWVAGWAADVSILSATFYGIKKVSSTGAKIAIGAVGGTLSALTWLTLPVLIAVTGSDKCKATDLSDNQEKLNTCVESSAVKLNQRFGDEINQALNNPDRFRKTLSLVKPGLGARLGCAVAENLLDQWNHTVATMSCQGRTLSLGGETYLINRGGWLYRHEGMKYTLKYGFNGRPLVINDRSGTGYQHTPTIKELREVQSIQSLGPRIREVIKGCSVQPESSFRVNQAITF